MVFFVGVMVGMLGLCQGVVATSNATALNRYTMIMSHDFASGYLRNNFITKWAKTQAGGLTEQLDCGARAFDVRPEVNDDKLKFHHGAIHINHMFNDSLSEVKQWLAVNQQELVVMEIAHCQGSGCVEKVITAATSQGITPVTHCSELSGMTVGAAKARGAMKGQGGSLLMITGLARTEGSRCSIGHFVPSMTCFGYVDKATPTSSLPKSGVQAEGSLASKEAYSCLSDSSTRHIPFDKMYKYLDSISAGGPPSGGHLVRHQALWQEDVHSVVEGMLNGGSLLNYESRSNINKIIAEQIRAGRWKYLNLLEVNNVCDPGATDLVAAVSEFNNRQNRVLSTHV